MSQQESPCPLGRGTVLQLAWEFSILYLSAYLSSFEDTKTWQLSSAYPTLVILNPFQESRKFFCINGCCLLIVRANCLDNEKFVWNVSRCSACF